MNFLIQLIVGVILSLASTLLQQAFAEKQKAATGTRGTVDIGGKVPQYFLIGTVAEAGKREYRNTWGHNGDVPNAYLTDVLSFGDLPITAMVGAFVNGTRITLASSGAVGQGFPVAEFDGKLWWKFLDGTQTSADLYLTSKFVTDADRPWVNDMIGRGVPMVITTALWDEKVWTKFPEFIGEFQGIPLYDVTKDSTAGGSGTQRWANPATWAFSDNNAVMIYNILRGISYAGKKVWGGSCEAGQLPYDVWAAAINACNQNVGLVGGGTEKRFRAGRRVNLNEMPADVIKELLIGCNARISHASDGTVYILVGVPAEADGAFSDADVLATEPLGAIPFPNLDSLINGGTATYREPKQAWEDKETAPYYRADLEAEDDGRQQVEGFDLGTTFSGTQAQRILKAIIEEGRRFRTHVVGLPPEFARFHPLSVLAWTSDRFGYSGKLFLVTARTRDPWGNVVLGLQEVDPTDHRWSPDEDEQPLSFAPVVVNRPPPQPMTGWGAEPAYIPDNDGVPRRPTIGVLYAANLVDVRAIRIQVRLAGATSPVFDGEVPYDPTPDELSVLLYGTFLPDTDYEVRGKYLPFSGRETLWSNQDEDGSEGPWLAVTTPELPDVDLPPIAPSMLGEELTGAYEFIALDEPGTLSSIIDAFREDMDNIAGALATANMTANVIRTLVEARFGSASAAVFTEQQARATQYSALASQITEVAAELPNAIAGGLLKLEGTVDPGGASATIQAKARAEVNGVLSQAAWIVRAAVAVGGDVEAYFGVLGDFYVFNTVDGAPIPAFGVEDGIVKFKGGRTERLSSPNEVSYLDLSDNPGLHLESGP